MSWFFLFIIFNYLRNLHSSLWPRRGEKYPFFFESIFSRLCFFFFSFSFFPLRVSKGPLPPPPPPPPHHLLFSLSLSFGWTNVEAREHLNTLAQWWTQAEGWCALGAGHRATKLHTHSLSLLSHTHSVGYSAYAQSRTQITETLQKTISKWQHKIINNPGKQNEAPMI